LPRELRKIHGGMCAIILDGVADFVNDPNDSKETNPFVTELEEIATEHDCAVIGVLHLNPAPGGNPTKSRGHLGSQLERKCETDLRLIKDGDGVTAMFTACARRAPIIEKDGLRFAWCSEAGMHVSLQQTAGTLREHANTESLRELAADVFGTARTMRYGEVLAAIKTTLKCSDSTSERRFNAMKGAKVITRFPPNLWGFAA
jgi:hypothetical protein